MLGHLVQAHSAETYYAVSRPSLRRWLGRVVNALLYRRTQ
jgi:hypothetical protein